MYTIGIGICNKKKKPIPLKTQKLFFLRKSIRSREELRMRCSVVIKQLKFINLKLIINKNNNCLETRFFVVLGKNET